MHVRNFAQGLPWIPGVEEVRGPVSYAVRLEDGRVVRRHVDHLRPRETRNESPANQSDTSLDDTLPIATSAESERNPPEQADASQGDGSTSGSNQVPLRRVSRTRNQPSCQVN